MVARGGRRRKGGALPPPACGGPPRDIWGQKMGQPISPVSQEMKEISGCRAGAAAGWVR